MDGNALLTHDVDAWTRFNASLFHYFGVKMVVDTRFELVTPAMSMQCSTTELIDHPI